MVDAGTLARRATSPIVISSGMQPLDFKPGSTVKVWGMTTAQSSIPNHHANYPGFTGLGGFLAAASMVAGGGGNARLAERISHLAAGEAVADIGCGPGTAARRAARLGAQVFGVDPAP